MERFPNSKDYSSLSFNQFCVEHWKPIFAWILCLPRDRKLPLGTVVLFVANMGSPQVVQAQERAASYENSHSGLHKYPIALAQAQQHLNLNVLLHLENVLL